MMLKAKQTIIFFVISLLLSSFTYSHGKISNFPYWEEIKIPIDTANQGSRYYPIDVRVKFSHPCWARNEVNRSVRVFVYHNGEYSEIESQIYNLEFIDNSHIKSCNLVFLVPDFADGRERYFVAYSDNPTPAPEYEDHVSLREGRFYYEPIRGYEADVRYYLIEEDGYAPFLVCYDGSVTGLRFAQRIVKLKEKSRDISLNNWLVATTYALIYLDKTKPSGSVGSMERFLSKKIFVDGNLMVRFGIETESFDGNLLTRNVYTYYYSPTSDKRIIVSSYQKIKERKVSTGTGAQGGNIVTMITSIIRSANIEELNTGLFIPYIHFFSEENIIKEYKFSRDAGGARRRWIILPEDDEDLGKKPWISMDFGSKGDTFALIFTNTSLFSKGREGLQVTAGLSKWIDMPGLLIQGTGISVGRNSYEKGEKEILELPSNLETSFVSEFYYTKDGYLKIKNEADRFARAFSSTYRGRDWNRSEKIKRKVYNLTVIPTLQGLSYPLIAAVSRFPIPIVTVELYKDGHLVSSALLKRNTLIKLKEIPENLRDIGKYLYLDAKNVSILQKVKFPKLEEGKYVVKVYFRFGRIKKFVGLKVVNLKKDKTYVIVCKPEARLKYNLKDQYSNPIKGINLNVIKDGEVVGSYISDNDGEIKIRLPLSDYRVEAFYKNLKLFSDEIKTKDFLPMLSLRRDKKIHFYNLDVRIIDSFGLPFRDNLHVGLNGVKADFADGNYIFTRIPEGNYTLRLLYKSFEYEEPIHLDGNKRITIEIPVSYTIDVQVKDLLDNIRKDIAVEMHREGREILKSENVKVLQIPPGKYRIDIFEGDRLIASNIVNVHENLQMIVYVDENPVEIYVLVTAFILFLITILLFAKRKPESILLSLSMFLIIISISLPVWELFGRKGEYQVYSKLHLFSSKVFTFKSYQDLSWGEAATLPSIVGDIFRIIIFIIILDVLMTLSHLVWKDDRKGKISIVLSISLSVIAISVLYILLSIILSASVGGIWDCKEVVYEFPNTGEIHIASIWFLGKGFLFLILALCSKILYVVLNSLQKRNSS